MFYTQSNCLKAIKTAFGDEGYPNMYWEGGKTSPLALIVERPLTRDVDTIVGVINSNLGSNEFADAYPKNVRDWKISIVKTLSPAINQK